MSTLGLCLFFYITICSYAYENVALNKQAYQQYQYLQLAEALTDASNAVDGLKTNLSVWGGQCVISENNQHTATWWVNLTNILSIHHITIYYRTEHLEWGSPNGYASRFLGFSLYVSNTTNKSDGKLCFEDKTFDLSTIPAVFNTTCPAHGQYVIFYNERLTNVAYPSDYSLYAYNELCEVEVSGCPLPGFYGYNCSIPCPDTNCRFCHIESGTCQGCKPGYQGHQCEIECSDGFYGDGCLHKCGACLDLSQCNHIDGTCSNNCKPGYKGDQCMQMCDIGAYGVQCNETCGICEGTNMCDRTDGTCLQGCEAGYRGDLCKTMCQNSKYGANCNEPCGKCHDSSQCHHVNGSCMEGCDPGYQGEKCIAECDFGYYGFKCLQECSKSCKTSRDCHHVTGSCIKGCESGWQGNDCLEVLKAGDTNTDWKSSFYGMTGAFFITLVLNGLFIAYILKARRKKQRRATKYQHSQQIKKIENQRCKIYENEVVDGGYQELGELNKDSTNYSTLSPRL